MKGLFSLRRLAFSSQTRSQIRARLLGGPWPFLPDALASLFLNPRHAPPTEVCTARPHANSDILLGHISSLWLAYLTTGGIFLLEIVYGYVKLFFNLCKNKKAARRVQRSFWGVCGVDSKKATPKCA
jgi:hypothetical protein